MTDINKILEKRRWLIIIADYLAVGFSVTVTILSVLFMLRFME